MTPAWGECLFGGEPTLPPLSRIVSAPAMSVKRDFPDLPPIWMFAHGALAWVVARWVPLASFEGGVARAIGTVLIVVGVGLAAWASVHFAKGKTSIEPRERPRTLLATGPFRVNRNPIYTGMALVLLGWALWLGTLSALLAIVPFPFIIDRRFVRSEEAMLREVFGKEADIYIAETRRW